MKIERRSCERFSVPGSTISYRSQGLFSRFRSRPPESHPMLDLSKGGLSFLTDRRPRLGEKLSLLVSCPDWSSPILVSGKVVYVGGSPVRSYKYRIGFQFNPYGPEKGRNSLESLNRLDELEKTYVPRQS
ncbi:MAG TPA: PilZ domain-containing protein [Thermodesulfovibrionales bacterium]|nr:PilZ domain-containing protein [Thermodesulfovibrionales bacterium]